MAAALCKAFSVVQEWMCSVCLLLPQLQDVVCAMSTMQQRAPHTCLKQAAAITCPRPQNESDREPWYSVTAIAWSTPATAGAHKLTNHSCPCYATAGAVCLPSAAVFAGPHLVLRLHLLHGLQGRQQWRQVYSSFTHYLCAHNPFLSAGEACGQQNAKCQRPGYDRVLPGARH